MHGEHRLGAVCDGGGEGGAGATWERTSGKWWGGAVTDGSWQRSVCGADAAAHDCDDQDAAPPQSDPDTLVSVLRPLGVTVFKFSNAPFLHRWFLPPRAARHGLSAAPGGAAGERCTEVTLRFLDNVPISEGDVRFLSRRRIDAELLLEIDIPSVWTTRFEILKHILN